MIFRVWVHITSESTQLPNVAGSLPFPFNSIALLSVCFWIGLRFYFSKKITVIYSSSLILSPRFSTFRCRRASPTCCIINTYVILVTRTTAVQKLPENNAIVSCGACRSIAKFEWSDYELVQFPNRLWKPFSPLHRPCESVADGKDYGLSDTSLLLHLWFLPRKAVTYSTHSRLGKHLSSIDWISTFILRYKSHSKVATRDQSYLPLEKQVPLSFTRMR